MRNAEYGVRNMELTRRQKEALALDRHLAITAGAGSGKTLVLVERYFQILDARLAGVDEILAITFTEKAAGEMKSRIYERVVERFEALQKPLGEHSEELINYWEDVMEAITESSISTIHSFCCSLLREFPVEAGVAPDFDVLDENDALLLRHEVVSESLRDMADGGDADFETLCSFWEYGKCSENLEYLLGAGLNAVEWGRRYSEWETGEVSGHLKNILQKLLHKQDDKDEVLLKDNFTSLFLSALARVFIRVVELYLKGKGNGLLLDFNDLEIYALNLLSKSPQVKDMVRKRYRFVMVDEFQDVSPIQWEIIKEICSFADDGKGNIFIVGDEKQSIYEFRGADVTIFKGARDRIQKANKKLGRRPNLNKKLVEAAEDIGQISLDTNFRSHPKLMDFYNTIFSEIFSCSEIVGRVHLNAPLSAIFYDQMKAWRDAEQQDAADSAPRVEIIFETGEAELKEDQIAGRVHLNAPKEEREKKTAELVAVRIRQLIYNNHNTEGASSRPLSFNSKDIAILFRKRTHLKLYEEALRKYGIPFVVVGGIGFYERQEVEDIIMLLKFLADPRRNATLVGVLRSTIFGISDEELFRIAIEEGETLLDRLRKANEEIDGEKFSSQIRFAHKCIARWLAAAGRIPTAALVRRALEDTGYYGAAGSGLRGAQSMANIDKVLNLIRNHEFTHGCNLHRTAEFLSQMRSSEPREAEAALPLDETEGVRLLTIHASKGLEFRVVVLTGLSDKIADRTLHSCILGKWDDGEYEIGANLGDENEGLRYIRTSLQKSAQNKETDEAKRLLYVACTRARDLLILSGFGNDCRTFSSAQDQAERWDRWIHNALNALGFSSYEDAGIAVVECVPSVETEFLKPEITDDFAMPNLKYLQPIILPPGRGRFSVTEIAEFIKDKDGYYDRQILGIQQDCSAGSPDPAYSPLLRGEIVHKLFEHLGNLTSVEIEKMFDDILTEYKITDNSVRESLHQKYLPRSVNFLNSELGHRVFSRGAKREFPFLLKVKDWTVAGKVDALFLDNGLWHIVDYKTDEIDAAQIPEKAKGYHLQLKIYALAVMKLLPAVKEIRGMFYFVEPERASELERFPRSQEKEMENSLVDILSEMTKYHALTISSKSA
ncbi:MAG: UvrD-helicase domain-containing protein [bacterium]